MVKSDTTSVYLGYARMLWSSIISLWHADIKVSSELYFEVVVIGFVTQLLLCLASPL